MVVRNRGMAALSRYTDKRTTVFASPPRSLLARDKIAELACGTMITHIKFVSVPVRDQNRALDFYTEKLGFTIITDQPFDEKQRWIELRVPKAETRGGLFTAEGEEKRIGWVMEMWDRC